MINNSLLFGALNIGALIDWTGIGTVIRFFLDIVCFIICVPVYTLIKGMFNLFITISQLDILSSTDISGIYQRFTIILTVVMVFYITFEFVKYTVNPDKISDKEEGGGKLAYRIIISILLIAFVPTIFEKAYELQSRILKTNVFAKIILGEESWDYGTLGSAFAADTFSAFFRVDYDACGNQCGEYENKVEEVISGIKEGGGGSMIVNMGSALLYELDDAIDFHGLFALVFGIFALYILFLYCFDMGTRYAQLLFLQIMSPVAIIGYISPKKDNIFQKWLKQCIATYIELFLRLIIIYFVLTIIRYLGDALSPTANNGDNINFLVYIFMICGLLIFAQKAPKMIEELVPSISSSAKIGRGLSFKERGEPLSKSFNAIKKPIAATAGAISGVNRMKNKFAGKSLGESLRDKKFRDNLWVTTKSAAKGFAAGAKDGKINSAISTAKKTVRDAEKRQELGGSEFAHDFRVNKFQDIFENFERRRALLEEVSKSKDNVEGKVEKLQPMKDVRSIVAGLDNRNISDRIITGKFADSIQEALEVYAATDPSDRVQARSDFCGEVLSQLSIVYNPEIDKAKANGNTTLAAELEEEMKRNLRTIINSMDGEIQNGNRLSAVRSAEADALQKFAQVGDIDYKDDAGIIHHQDAIPESISLSDFISKMSGFNKAAGGEKENIATSEDAKTGYTYQQAKANADQSK